MPFGLSNAPACFERLMELVLRGLLWEKCLCYLDDVIVMGKTFEDGLANLELVFERFRAANLKLKPKKCVLFQSEVLFLGHRVTVDGITTDPSKVEAVQSWPQPTSLSELRSFLGLVGYYRRFIPNFSDIASPLTKLTRKYTKCEESFQKLKELLVSAPVLGFPEGNGTFILDTDASLHGIGAVLSQVQNGEEKVISYASKKLNRSQKNYCTTYRELLAVVHFVRQFRHYLWGRPFLIRTDHSSLVWLKSFKSPEGILARWLSVLDTFDFTLEHRKGSHHVNADAMSRKPYSRCKRDDCSQCQTELRIPDESSNDGEYCHHKDATASLHNDTPDLKEMSPDSHHSHRVSVNTVSSDQALPSQAQSNWLSIWSSDDIRSMQENDLDLAEVLKMRVESEQKPPRSRFSRFSDTAKFFHGNWESLRVKDGILYFQRKSENPALNKLVLVAPAPVRQTIFEHLHSKKTAGHLGRDKTLFSIQRRFIWPGMSTDIKRWIYQCDLCCRSKPGPGMGRSPLQQTPVSFPLEKIAIDIIGPCPKTSDGNEYIIVLCDYFTKWSEAYPVPNHTALTVADKLCTEFISRFGTPLQIHTDQGKEFESELFQELCKNLEIDKTRTAPYRPNSDGLVERFNKTLQQMLKVFVNSHRNDWDDHIPYLLMAYRSTIQESTGCTPNKLMLGREISLPLDLIVGEPPDANVNFCPVEYVEWIRHSMGTTFEFANKNLEKAAVRQKKYYDRNLKHRTYERDDFVWRWYPPTANVKLGLGWTGPYKILQRISDVTYQIQRLPDSNPIVVHVDHLKPYTGVLPPSSWESSFLNGEECGEQSSDSPEIDMSDVSPVGSPDTSISPDTVPQYQSPVRTRCGRQIKKPTVYSP